ncbi:WxL domain-containing protein [Sinobaca sp. H24]|uniref:WxL domain-containing protein n=1 Tax=Sinobaca sp. H24 TaxID=2923376 RepID=UPI00207A4492|nr:WxL domain-containing protein [Sinobaca sp. H24]
MKKFLKRSLISTLTVSIAAVSFSTVALAEDSADVGVSAEVIGGTLTLSEINDIAFDSFDLSAMEDLSGSEAIGGAEGSFAVTDTTGASEGWNLNVSATDLALVDGDNVLENALSITAPTVTAGENSTSALAITTNAGSLGDATGINLMNAAAGEGLGEFDAAGSLLDLDVDYLDASPGTYSSTVTFNLTTGPETGPEV